MRGTQAAVLSSLKPTLLISLCHTRSSRGNTIEELLPLLSLPLPPTTAMPQSPCFTRRRALPHVRAAVADDQNGGSVGNHAAAAADATAGRVLVHRNECVVRGVGAGAGQWLPRRPRGVERDICGEWEAACAVRHRVGSRSDGGSQRGFMMRHSSGVRVGASRLAACSLALLAFVGDPAAAFQVGAWKGGSRVEGRDRMCVLSSVGVACIRAQQQFNSYFESVSNCSKHPRGCLAVSSVQLMFQ